MPPAKKLEPLAQLGADLTLALERLGASVDPSSPFGTARRSAEGEGGGATATSTSLGGASSCASSATSPGARSPVVGEAPASEAPALAAQAFAFGAACLRPSPSDGRVGARPLQERVSMSRRLREADPSSGSGARPSSTPGDLQEAPEGEDRSGAALAQIFDGRTATSPAGWTEPLLLVSCLRRER
mmetsp:Transcript_22414/g.63675  ORF Transcript_22414/g.63675 Transcript_22414/m.63675 type:complete len:186 (+) Transcript_22414:101-658(+)